MPKAEITLGAAQLGMAYGIANRRGKMDPAEVFEFLDTVFSAGITRIDTSPAYGDSESLIGQFLRESKYAVRVITKLPALGLSSPATAQQLIPCVERRLHASLEALGLAAVDDYLLHSEDDFLMHGAALVEALQHCRESGLVKRVGVSVYSPTAALMAAELGLDAVQIPCNILDQRLDRAGFFAAAEKYRLLVYSRSVYLQGLLLLPIEDVLSWLPSAEQPLRRFHQLAEDCGCPPAELAFVYMRDKRGIDSLVVGMETKAQLEANLLLIQAPALEDELLARIDKLFAEVPLQLLNPSLWRRT